MYPNGSYEEPFVVSRDTNPREAGYREVRTA